MKIRRSPYTVLFLLILVMVAGWWFVDYMAWDNPRLDERDILDEQRRDTEVVIVGDEHVFAENDDASVDDAEIVDGFIVEEVVDNLFVPWSIVFTGDDRFLVSERSGAIREVIHDELVEKPLHVLPDVSSTAEEGLMGLALDPLYKDNGYVYACYATGADDVLTDRVVRLTDDGNALVNEQIIVDGIPAAKFHAGCRLGFGPDNKLYITTGEATNKEIAQDLESLGGKILRVNTDGTIPKDNPFPDSLVYTYGHRNPQGITWNSQGVMLSTEHGPSIFDGPAGGDEVNVIEAGLNYGWPLVSHDQEQDGLMSPLIQFTPAEAPGSALAYSGDVFADWKDDLFFGALKGESVIRVEFADQESFVVGSYERLDLGVDVGRVREVAEGPDGYIYFTTSNRDGRGSLRDNDDKVYRIVPRGL